MPTLEIVQVPADEAVNDHDNLPQQSSAANASANSVITPAEPTPTKQKKRSQQQLTLDALFGGGVTKKPKSREDTPKVAAKENATKASTTKAPSTSAAATVDIARKSALLDICVGRQPKKQRVSEDTVVQELVEKFNDEPAVSGSSRAEDKEPSTVADNNDLAALPKNESTNTMNVNSEPTPSQESGGDTAEAPATNDGCNETAARQEIAPVDPEMATGENSNATMEQGPDTNRTSEATSNDESCSVEEKTDETTKPTAEEPTAQENTTMTTEVDAVNDNKDEPVNAAAETTAKEAEPMGTATTTEATAKEEAVGTSTTAETTAKEAEPVGTATAAGDIAKDQEAEPVGTATSAETAAQEAEAVGTSTTAETTAEAEAVGTSTSAETAAQEEEEETFTIPERVQVLWELSNGKRHWWGATVLEHDGRTTDDGTDIHVLHYDPYKAGGYEESTHEDAVFLNSDTLESVGSLLDYRPEQKGKAKKAKKSAEKAKEIEKEESPEQKALRLKYKTRGDELLERYTKLVSEEALDIPVTPSEDATDDFSDAAFPSFAVKSLASFIEGKCEPLVTLAPLATAELNRAYNTDKFTQDMTQAKIKLLATRKNLVNNAVAVLTGGTISSAKEDASPLWRWEVTVLELLPESALGQVRKVRAARKKLAAYLNAVVKLVSSSNPEREEERVLKFEREEEKIRLLAESKREKELEKQQAKLKREEDLKRKKEQAALEAQRKKDELALEKQRKKEQLALEKQRKKEQLALEKQQKLDMKKQAEEAKRQKAEDERKKKEAMLAKQQNSLMSIFYVSKKQATPAKNAAQQSECKPIVPKTTDTFDVDVFRSAIGSGNCPKRPFSKLSNRARKSRRPRTRRATVPVFVTVLPDNPFAAQPYAEQQNIDVLNKYKFLLFHEDVRPAYYGTWSKASKIITGKNPWGKDATQLDYDLDSEAEWEEGDDEVGEDTENIADDEEEKDDDEGSMAEDGWLAADDEIGDDMDEETRALRRKQLENSNENREVLTVSMIAPNHGRPLTTGDEKARDLVDGMELQEACIILKSHTAQILNRAPLCMEAFPPPLVEETTGSNEQTSNEMTKEEKKTFVEFVHNSSLASKEKLLDELRKEHSSITSSRAQAQRMLDAVAVKNKIHAGGVCWNVKPEVLVELGLEGLVGNDAGETRQEEILKAMAEAVHHTTFTSKDKAADELRANNVQLADLSRAEAVRLIEAVASKKKHPTGVYWELKPEMREKLGLSNLPSKFPGTDDDNANKAMKQLTVPIEEPTKDSTKPNNSEVSESQPSTGSASKKRPAGSAKLLASYLVKKRRS